MKVLVAIVVPPTVAASGAMKAALRLASALAGRVRIDIACMARLPTLDGPLRIVPVSTRNPLDSLRRVLPQYCRTPFHCSNIPSIVASGGYDLVHIHNPIPALEMRRVARASLRAGVPYVVHTHGFVEIASGPSAFRLPAATWLAWRLLVDGPVRFVVRHAHRVFALSPADRRIAEDFGADPTRIVIVTNGVDLPGNRMCSEQHMGEVCASYGVPYPKPQDRLACFYLGNHVPNKGVAVMLEAFAATRVPYILVVGGKKREWIPYERYITGAGPGQTVIFTDRIAEADIDALYRYADIFVFPSLADTLPLVVLDAMAHGKPVLATTVGGIPYQLEGECGRLVPPGDAMALRAAFEGLVAHPEHLKSMGQRGLQRARQLFNWDRSAELAHAAFREVLDQRART